VTAKGFQTVSQEIDTHWEASRRPTIYLVPLAKKNSPQATPPTVSVTELAAPKRARKEFEKGAQALQKGKTKEAREHLEKAVAEDPCYARAQTALGVALSMQREPAAAESAFDKAIKCDAGFLEAYVQMAVLLNSQAKYKQSQAMLDEGLRRFPNEWRLHYQLGITLDGSRNYETAEKEFLKAQSLEPAVPPEFHLRLADVYLNWKKFDRAHAELEAYLRAEPNGRFAEPTRGLMHRMESEGLLTSAQSRRDQK
jgi:tetratricopeptide (TPR) repeat protein